MQNRSAATVLLILMAFATLMAGCVSEKKYPAGKPDAIMNAENFDLDGDGIDEFHFYSFGASRVEDAKATIQRYVFASAEKSITFKKPNPLGTDDVNQLDLLFEDFISSRDYISENCNRQLGVSGVRCLDPKTCAKLCAAASEKCKQFATDGGDVLGQYIVQYVKDNTDAYSQTTAVRNDIPKLKTMPEEKTVDVGNKHAKIETSIASVNANPLMRAELFGLCDHDDYALGKIRQMLLKMGGYDAENEKYTYRVFIKITSEKQGGQLVYNDLLVSDTLPSDVDSGVQISSPQQISRTSAAGRQTVEWPVVKPYLKRNEILAYEFQSTVPPSELLSRLEKPQVTVKTTDMGFLYPTVYVLNALNGVFGNYYLALGASFALTAIFAYMAYTLLLLVYYVGRVKMAGESAYQGLKRVVGRTGVKWKGDALVGAGALALGVAVAFLYAPAGQDAFDFFGTADLLIHDIYAFIASFGVFFGAVMLYSAIDNYARVGILERIYGQQFKEDKDLFVVRVSQLKARVEELQQLVEKLSRDSFEVGSEYDILSRISMQHISDLARKGDVHARKYVEAQLGQVEDAIEGLHERKKTADESWSKWSEAIARLVEENEEVYVSNLVTIPSSLRMWALNKFANEHREKGLIFEGDVIKKKAVTPEKMARALLDKELLLGAVILKNGKLYSSQMAGGSGTVQGVLALKLMNYLRTLDTKLRMHEYESVAVVGEKAVMAFLKYRNVESLVFVKKEKFKEAIEDWKGKIKGM